MKATGLTSYDTIKLAGDHLLADGSGASAFLAKGTKVKWGVQPKTRDAVMHILDGDFAGATVYTRWHR